MNGDDMMENVLSLFDGILLDNGFDILDSAEDGMIFKDRTTKATYLVRVMRLPN